MQETPTHTNYSKSKHRPCSREDIYMICSSKCLTLEFEMGPICLIEHSPNNPNSYMYRIILHKTQVICMKTHTTREDYLTSSVNIIS